MTASPVDPPSTPRTLGRTRLVPLFIFLAGCIGAAVVWLIPGGRNAFFAIAGTGYAGALAAGVLYAISFTAPSATVLFAALPESANPILAALIGGLGALAYDLFIFSFARFESHQPWYEKVRERFSREAAVPNWLKLGLGAFILASPLPDELAAGLLGLSNIRASRFALISFLLNSVGILAIISIGRSGA